MTNAEYNKLYYAATQRWPYITRDTMRELAKIYDEAAKIAAEAVRTAQLAGLSDLTSGSWSAINQQLAEGASMITNNLTSQIPETIRKGSKTLTGIDQGYLVDVADKTGLLDTAKIENMFVSVNNQVLADMVSRIYSNGYSFSDRIWQVGEAYQQGIRQVISQGVALGRDVVDIAQDLKVYVKEGRGALAKRWGDLIKGTPEWSRRIPKDIDYRALRLVRSELYASLQETSKRNGLVNPACDGWYDWIRATSEDWNCDCPDNEAGSPYKYEDIPGWPHPNCLCYIQPHLRDRREFEADLARWADGESVDYLDNWNTNYYQYS